jgi:hypothetical protein
METPMKNLNASTPINLREKFGHRYRIEYDPAHTGRKDDPWLQIIPCKRGHVYPHGGNLLGIATSSHGSTATAIAKLERVTVLQEGDDGINAIFPVELLPKIAKLVKPRRKRQLSDKERQAAVERLTKHRFSTPRQSQSDAPESMLAL